MNDNHAAFMIRPGMTVLTLLCFLLAKGYAQERRSAPGLWADRFAGPLRQAFHPRLFIPGDEDFAFHIADRFLSEWFVG
jgi:hypothetical protein